MEASRLLTYSLRMRENVRVRARVFFVLGHFGATKVSLTSAKSLNRLQLDRGNDHV